jgi:hypothetical protein
MFIILLLQLIFNIYVNFDHTNYLFLMFQTAINIYYSSSYNQHKI